MKILVLNWQDLANPQSGGAEIHLHEIFGRLARRGHEVTLLCSGWPGARPRAESGGMQIRRTGGRNTFSLAAPAYYRRHLAAQPWDVVVEDLNKVPLFAPYWVRRPLVLLVHHLFGATAFREASAPFAAATWLLERPIPFAYRGLPAEAVSESTADDLVARGLRREDIRVIHNGVDLKFFSPDPRVARLPQPTFLYVGRLKRYKRIDQAVDAVALLRDRGTHVRLLVAGRGDEEPRLRAQVERLGIGDRVTFEGFVTEERKRELLRACWGTVLPSPKEGWGITNIEAAACGTPAVAADSPGLRESVVHDRTGLLVPYGDVEKLADALGGLAADPERVAALGAAGRVFAEGFSWERSADLTEAHLAQVAGQRIRRGSTRDAPGGNGGHTPGSGG
ncbi:glycosyltransferase family 4 protein [Longimicrobium sp.]|uniref:glycosyltransferase family 4 protein n=1 Tax=Longimicrobium sp. TaxID=2029185 RepID=UPI003B3AAAEB